MVGEYARDMRREFRGYGAAAFQSDALAGVTVAAVALPLALAFGVGSGADAASGLITAIVSAFVIGLLGGASFQISGPTGAMTAILIPLAARYGMQGIFAAGVLAGVILIAAGLLKMGKLVYYLPAPVIAGFTSGIAVIIALGQLENLFGVRAEGTEALERFLSLFRGFAPNWFALFIGLFVILLMLLWPKKWAAKVPGSLAGVLAATAVALILPFEIERVGDIPRTLIHEQHLTLAQFFASFDVIVVPAVSIAALGMIESLLCGVAGGRMKGEKLNGDRELIAQGIGNLILPFMGGVPATAAIARTSVAVKSGCRTRLAGAVQGLVLLLSMFLLAPLMSRIPLAALAGVLIVTAWRMNEWHSIRYIFGRRFKYGAAKFLITMIVTVLFDLTIAIAAGAIVSIILFVTKISDLDVKVSEFDPARFGAEVGPGRHTQLVHVTGPIFFGAIDRFESGVEKARGEVIIFLMRGMPYIDTSGVQTLMEFCQAKKKRGVTVSFVALQPKVRDMLVRGGIAELLGPGAFFDNVMDALARAKKK